MLANEKMWDSPSALAVTQQWAARIACAGVHSASFVSCTEHVGRDVVVLVHRRAHIIVDDRHL